MLAQFSCYYCGPFEVLLDSLGNVTGAPGKYY